MTSYSPPPQTQVSTNANFFVYALHFLWYNRFMMTTVAVEINDFTKKYQNVTAVNNLNFSVAKGKIVGFVGKNGAGKSTTLRALFNLIKPTAGSMKVFGLDSQKNAKEIKRLASYVASEASFYDNITCKQLLQFALFFTESSLEDVEDLALYFELDLTKKINTLSLGNRKKLSLIQGLIKKSQLLVLDEPTNGLDPLMQNKLFALLRKEQENGTTILLSSHNLSEIEKYCDAVAIIKDGELVDFFDMKDVKIKHKQILWLQTKDGKTENYEIDEDINAVIAKLAKMDLAAVEIKTKTVEDEFIEYYRGDEKQHESN
ncbi:MAG: ABC transporter ATP-binding protein [Spirochaetales bacterium]